ncbi:MAG: DNA double-strand break repair nuclease NurA, partial [Elainellaceae cyanobacterium]
VLHYGQSRYPLLDSLPEGVYRPDDLYQSHRWGVRTDEWMGYRRTVSEAMVLSELAIAAMPQPLKHPALAMVDGSLIYWFLDTLPEAAQHQLLPPILAAWDKLRDQGIPVVGYISATRSSESLNFLRLHTCPYEEPDCQRHCAKTPSSNQRPPCHVFTPLRDAALWGKLLSPGQRSPLWRAGASILDRYGSHQVYFCYLHVGSEVARLEMPAWVANDAELLDWALTLTIAQVQKGYGYPVALAESHNQAVVRGGDRLQFFGLLEREMIRAGLKNIGTSYKEARKRGSVA